MPLEIFRILSLAEPIGCQVGSRLLESGIVPYAFKNVVVARVGRNSQFADVPWNFLRNGITGYKDYTQFQIGTMPVCWAAGSTGGGASNARCLHQTRW